MTNPIAEDFPLLARAEGVWDGKYTHFDINNRMVDEHSSRLICRIPDEPNPYPYHQTNHYTWDNGKTEARDFPAHYSDGRLRFDNELIKGWAAPVALDEFDRTMMLYWQRVGDPELYLYEMIQLSDCSKYRCRTWHWIRAGVLETRTAIQEELVTRDWRAIDAEMKEAEPA